MPFNDVNEAQRKAALKQYAEYVDSVEDRIAAAKARLGERYLLHPSNQVQKRTRPYGSAK